MNLFKKIEKEIHRIIQQKIDGGIYPAGLQFAKVEVTPPREAAHGDMATNAALIIAPQVGKNPKVIAEDLINSLPIRGWAGVGANGNDGAQQAPHLTSPLLGEEYIVKAEVAGPGFINLTLDHSVWQEAMLDILKEGRDYGNSNVGKGQRINVEYVSVNPTGPMHVGHARYIYGDALATLLIKAGYAVTREYYINDAGAQVDKVADSVFLRYREACGETIGEIPEGLYPGDYLVPVGEALLKAHGKGLLIQSREQWLPLVRDFSIESMMNLIKSDLAALGIHHDVFTSERALTAAGKVEAAIAGLEAKGLIYQGVLEAPKGKAPDDWEAREQTLFRSTQFGDDCDRAVKKSDGSWTYFAPDIAYQLDKINRGFDKLIMLLGIDHGGYVKRLQAAVKALSGGKVSLDVKLCQLVKFMRGGEPLKMSKRAGTFVTVREVVDEVGKDVFRFIMLTRKNDVPLDFDFAKVTEQSKDNPVFYVQYAHARAHSIMRRAAEELPEALELSSPSPLEGEGGERGNYPQAHVLKESPHPNPPPPGGREILLRLNRPEELALIRLMCNWPRLVESAALGLEPHRIAFYLQELAAAFHGFWNLGNDDLGLRFIIKSDIELSAARIALARAVSLVIASGLMVLGVEPVEEMR